MGSKSVGIVGQLMERIFYALINTAYLPNIFKTEYCPTVYLPKLSVGSFRYLCDAKKTMFAWNYT